MIASEGFLDWFRREEEWSRAGLLMAVALLLAGPFVYQGVGFADFLVYLQLPVYMLHQYEEHAHGAFQAFMNGLLAPYARVLSDRQIFWINIGGVWLLDTVVLYLAYGVGAAIGLIAPYLAIVNAVIHIGAALRQRRYNPGLWTSVLLFLPVGGYAVVVISRAALASPLAEGLALGAGILLHVIVIIAIARGRRTNGQEP